MRLGLAFGTAAALSLSMVAPAPAGYFTNVQFGRPDYSNYLSRPGTVSCEDWWYQNYFRACPTPHLPPQPAALPTHK